MDARIPCKVRACSVAERRSCRFEPGGKQKTKAWRALLLQLNQGSQIDMVAERFRVPEESAIRIQAEDMRPVVEGIFQGFGMPEADAKLSVDVLLYADVRGIDSHGVSNMVKHYEEWVGNGQLNPTPRPRVLREAPATVTIDGDCGLGLAIGPRAMKQAMEKAATCGIGAAAVVNVQHFGACAYHAALALDEDMIGVVMTTTGLCTAPTFGAEARLVQCLSPAILKMSL